MPDSDNYRDRLELIKRLSSLPVTQLDRVILALNPTRGMIPPATAKPGDRASALFEWAESPIGCGLEKLETVLDAVIDQAIPEPLIPEGTAENRRDVHVGRSLENAAVVSGNGDRSELNDYGLPATKPEPTRPDANEKILIEAVWTEVEDRLRQSLHNAILIRLDMAEQRSQVTRPWDSQLRTADPAAKPLDPNTHIVEVFDRRDVGGKLLILGNPGSGKTTTMLDLAAELIKRANAQPDHPIPVMFNLSSWQSAKQSITDWLLSELKLKYGVSQRLGKIWLAQKTLLPLLDGLDELPSKRQEPVVQAINEWLQSGEGPSRLLVCSRIEEYELYAAKLALNGAVCLEPLTDEQLQKYLKSMQMGELWETLQQDSALLELVRTPLLLSVSILANDAIEPEQWRQKQTTQERMTYLLDAYVERRLHELITSKEYPAGKEPSARQTRHWLVWLAKQLRSNSEDEFLIEKLQPNVLIGKSQLRTYRISCGIIFGSILTSLYYPLFSSISTSKIGLIYPLMIGTLMGFSCGLGVNRLLVVIFNNYAWKAFWGLEEIGLRESLSLSLLKTKQPKNWNCLLVGLLIGLSGGAILGLATVIFINDIELTYFVVFLGVYTGLTTGVFRFMKDEISVYLMPNQGMLYTIRNFMYFTFILLPVSIVFVRMTGFLMDKIFDFQGLILNSFLVSIAVGGSLGGGMACIQHFSLRVALVSSRCAPWNYARFLNHCTERLLLQRVGGRYRFIHKLVQEHFAAMER
ncbi:MAG: NACHT domain-containing protein [Leptolyngbyaceae cyanobacterium]